MDETRLTVIEKMLEKIEEGVKEVKCIAMDNRTALTGDLKVDGILTTLAILNQKLENTNTLTTNHLQHLSDRFDTMLTSRDLIQATKNQDNVGWKELVSEWMKPVITALLIAAILHFMNN